MLKNCTPHVITICSLSGEIMLNIARSGIVPRCSTTTKVVGYAASGDCPVCKGYGHYMEDDHYDNYCPCGGKSIPILETQFGEVTGLPPAEEGVYLIVSRLVLQACPERHDLLSPGELVRGPDGQPIGCKGLSR